MMRLSVSALCVLLVLSSVCCVAQDLPNGQTQDVQVAVNDWRYFTFRNTFYAGATIVMSITATAGDPDIYYSTTGNPTLDRFDGRQDSDGGGVLSVRNAALGQLFYIGIYADGDWRARADLFVIAYDPNNQQANPVRLSDGLPLNDALAAGEWRYFQYTLDSTVDSLSFSATGRSGDPDLFINGPNRAWPDGLVGAEWSAMDIGTDIITIRNPREGIYRIATYAWGIDIQYTMIAVRSGAMLLLTDGVSYPAALAASESAYYHFHVLDNSDLLATSTLTFSATQLNDWTDINLYCSFSDNGVPLYPSPTDYTWSSTQYGRDLVIISGAKEELRQGDYYCAAYAVTDVKFHIAAQLRAKGLLSDGLPIEGVYAQANTAQYFTFDTYVGSPNFTVTTVPHFGHQELYISRPNGAEPTVLDSASFMLSDRVTTYRGHSLFVPSSACNASTADPATSSMRCRYQILVWAPTDDTSFDIVAVYTNTSQMLRHGEIVYGTLLAGEYRYFTFVVTHPNSTVAIILTSVDGDPDLFVSLFDNNTMPTYDHSDWQARSGVGDRVDIDPSSPVLAAKRGGSIVGQYWISVFGFRRSTWDLRVKVISPDNPTGAFDLQNGVPVQSTLEPHQYDFFTFTVNAELWPTNVIITAEAYSGNPDLYVSNVTSRPDAAVPGSYRWSSTADAGAGARTDEVGIPWEAAACHFSDSIRICTFHIAVYAFHEGAPTRYALVARAGQTNVLLSNGNSFERALRTNQVEYYVFLNTHAGGTVTIGVTPISGDPGLFVSTTNPRPNATSNSQWRSDNTGGNMLAIRNATGAAYYIGVRALSNAPARYIILATSYDRSSINVNPVALINGRPVSDFLADGDLRHFYYRLGADVAKLTVYAQRRIGDPDLYVNLPSIFLFPNTTSSSLRSEKDGSDIIVVRPAVAGTYRVSVYAYGDTQYQLTALESDSIMVMSDGVSYASELQSSEYDYYAYTILPQLNVTNRVLSFSLTSFAGQGDFDIFCSTVHQFPSWYPPNYEYVSLDFDADSIVISANSDPPLRATTYYCAVRAYEAGQYSLTASFAEPIRLQAGTAHVSTLAAGALQYYVYDMPADAPEPFVLSITPSRGITWLYLSNRTEPDFDDPSTYQLSSRISFYQAQGFPVPADYCPRSTSVGARCVFRILAYAQSDSTYTILISTPNSNTVMQPGVSYDSEAAEGGWRYFSFTVPEDRMRVSLQLTSAGGDSNLYISRSGRPQLDAYDWVAWLPAGEDSLTFDWSDPHFTDGSSMAGTYYVGVNAGVGYGTAFFRLVLMLTSESGQQTVVDVVAGQPYRRTIPENTYDFYRFVPPVDGWPYNIIITLTPTSGDPDLFVMRNWQPARNNYTWFSVSPAGNPDVIVIPWNDTRSCSPVAPVPVGDSVCSYQISVDSFSTAGYTLIVNLFNANGTLVPTELLNGLTYTNRFVVANMYDQYYFVPPYANGVVVFIVTPLSGNPDLYGATFPYPTRANHTWTSSRAGTDILVVFNSTSPVYFFSVHGQGQTGFSRYSVQALWYDPVHPEWSVVALGNAQLQRGFVGEGGYRYYTYSLAEQGIRQLTIGLVPILGDADLYVNFPQVDGLPAVNWPSTASYDRESLDPSGYEVVAVTNPAFGTYRIAVYGYDSSAYSLIAYHSGTSVEMAAGVVYPGILAPGQWQYYRFVLTQFDGPFANKQLSFAVHNKVGDADVYCSDRYTMPNETVPYNWSAGNFGSEIISISGSQAGQLHMGVYYCGVVGYTQSTYSFAAYFGPRNLLVDGVVQYDVLQPGEVRYYTFEANPGPQSSDIIITTQADPGQAYIYVSKSPAEPNPPQYSWQWSSAVAGYTVQTLTIPASNCLTAPAGSSVCTYNIAVWSPNAYTSYTVLVGTANGTTVLTSGLPVTGHVGYTQSRFYTFSIPQPRMNWSLIVTAGEQDVDVFVSRYIQRPTYQTAEWAGLNTTSEFVFVDYRDPHYVGGNSAGQYYVTVYGFETADYTILLQLYGANGSVVYLSDGQPQLGVVADGDYQYYIFTPPAENWPYIVYFSLSVLVGDPNLYVRKSTDSLYPTASSYGWASTNSALNLDQVIIGPNTTAGGGACLPSGNSSSAACSYVVAVYGLPGQSGGQGHRYYIVATTSKSNERLLPGVQVGPRRLLAAANDYYFFQNTVAGHTVMISLIPSYGDPDIYISSRVSFPNASSYDIRGERWLWDVIEINNASAAVYYLTIHSANQEPSEYSLMATSYDPAHPELNVVTLVPGRTVRDALGAWHWRYYDFYLGSEEATDALYITLINFNYLESGVFYGDADVYVNFYDDRPNVWPNNRTQENGAEWFAQLPGDDILTIRSPRNGRYLIAVHAADNKSAVYSITAQTAGSVQSIVDGQPLEGRLMAGQYNYYRFQIPTLVANADLTFTLTADYGNPDLYVVDSNTRPSNSSFRWSSAGTGIDSVVISNTSAPGSVHVGTYTAAVYARDATAYSIVVSYNSRITLYDGSNQRVYLTAGGQQLLQLTLPGPNRGEVQPVTFQTIPRVGNAYIYIGVNTTPVRGQQGSWQYISASGSNPSQLVTVPQDACTGNRDWCVYTVLLYSPNQVSDVNLIATTPLTATLLREGEPVQGSVIGLGAPMYYRFMLSSNFVNVTVRLTTTAGNADLFCSYRFPQPDASLFDWSSRNTTEDDVVYFDYQDPIFRNPAIIMARMYYCAVLTNLILPRTTYRIVYTVTDSSGQSTSVVSLLDGMPETASVQYGRFAYFSFSPSAANYPYDVYVQLVAESGDPDMYVTSNGLRPDLINYQWRSTADSVLNSVEMLTIPSSSPYACSLQTVQQGRCTYNIAVYAWDNGSRTYNTRFTILVSTSNPQTYTTLTAGIPQQGVVAAGAWHYYAFTVATDDRPLLTIALTALSGNPDLYWNTTARPNITSQGSNQDGGDVVQFFAQRARYLIGVRGNSTASSNYLITASLGAIRLLTGLPQNDVVERGASRVYTFAFLDPAGTRNVVIDVIGFSFFTNLNMYVTADGSMANSSHWTWRSTADQTTANTLVINTTDPNYRRDAVYTITLTSLEQRSVYTITASDGVAPTTLLNGREYTVVTAVPMGEYRYFRGAVDNTERDLTFNVAVTAGSVSMFVSTANRAPSLLNHSWSASSSGGFEGSKAVSIVVPRSQIRSGYYYIGIRTDSAVAARYSVVMSTSTIQLTAGMSQQATCSSGAHYYQINLQQTPATLQDVSFLVTPANWDSATYSGRFNVYVSQMEQFPTLETASWSSGSSLGLNSEWKIGKDDYPLQACVSQGTRLGTGCTLFIGVSCVPPQADISFLFTVTVGKSLVPLVDAVYRPATLAYNQRDSYVSYVSEAKALWLMAETCRGALQLFVSDVTRTPTATTARWKSVKTQQGAVQTVVIALPQQLSNTMYFSAVQATSTTAEYRMWSMALTQTTTLRDLLPLVSEPTLSLSRDDEFVNVQFTRALLPTMYRNVAGYRYTLRYSLYMADAMSQWSMLSECGMNRTRLAARLNDAELDAEAETATLSVPLDLLYAEDTYKLNVLVSVVQQRIGQTGLLSTFWSVYDPALDVAVLSLPYRSNTNSPPVISQQTSSTMVAVYVLVPLLFFVLLIAGHFWYRRRRTANLLHLELLSQPDTGSEMPYFKTTDKDDGVYSNDDSTNGYTNGTNGTNGVHGRANGINGHTAAEPDADKREGLLAGSVETGDSSYVPNPTADNNYYTQ